MAAFGLLGGLLSLDRTAVLQTMASRPLVGATLAGWLVGDPALGLLAGLLLELLWLMDLPVGASVPPDESLSGVLAGVFAAAAPDAWAPEARAACGVLLAVPAGWAGRWADLGIRRWNAGLLSCVLEELGRGLNPPLARAHWKGALRFFAAGACLTAAGAAGGVWVLGSWAPGLPPQAEASLELVALLLPVLGGGAVLAGMGLRRHAPPFAAGLVGALGLERAGGVGTAIGGRPWRP